MELILPFLCLNLIILIITSSSSYLQPVTAFKKHDNTTDLEALLHFRAHADPHDVLAANWTANASFCSWVGVYCSHRRQRVTVIWLYDLTLQGSISPYLGNLSFLSNLHLSNNSFTGPIPESIGYLPRLTEIVLQYNFLNGPIPSSIFNMSSLINLGVRHNNLSGSLPSNNNSFPMPPPLRNIFLAENYFTGDALPSFLHFRDIRRIDLSINMFSGGIPTEIGTMSKLRILYLGGSQLTGTIPSSLGNLTELQGLDLNRNNLSGTIPEELQSLKSLQILNLNQLHLNQGGYGNIAGSIPTSLLNLSMLYFLDLGGNILTGSVPGGSIPLEGDIDGIRWRRTYNIYPTTTNPPVFFYVATGDGI